MPFTSELPKWDNVGTKPSDAKILQGYLFNEHPPANWWNYQMNRTYLALKELQEKSAEKIKATTSADGLLSKEDKAKLDGVATGANNYVHPSTHPASIITESVTKRFVADTEKTAWNAKETTSGAQTKADNAAAGALADARTDINSHANNTTIHVTSTEKTTWNGKANNSIANGTTNGLMSTADFNKLANIASNANNYTHPSSHPATMITEDSTHRFATDAEKTAWNSAIKGSGEKYQRGSATITFNNGTSAMVTVTFPQGFPNSTYIPNAVAIDTVGATACNIYKIVRYPSGMDIYACTNNLNSITGTLPIVWGAIG
ncbi:hypothetical protein M4D55_23480 [Metabacillus idriensis]|uniref:hypothetical protein n=1 Tax=Metabacillus idriensis TaxID=324768 RepID=UPI00203FD181|nr:hypothetical protein [Metabacillus idriensis]MCM3598725.1 hypothetical protein [Metabacillus idriensis]